MASSVSRPPLHRLKPAARSIAILPFSNLGPGADDDHIIDGLTEELINAIAQIEGVRVVSSGSVFQFKHSAQDAREIGRKLGVASIVQGSLRRSGDQLRVMVQLVDAADGHQAWSQRFDCGMKDIFTLQDELTATILDKLRVKLVREPPPPLQPTTLDLEAHQLYSRGRYFYNQQNEPSVRQAIDCFSRAVEVAPEYALPYSGLADCHALLAWYGVEPATEAMPRAKAALDKALHLDSGLVSANCLLATVQAGYDWDWRKAGESFRRALTLGSGFASVHFHYALDYLTPLGRLEEALSEIKYAQELDPLSLIVSTAVGGCLYRQRCYQTAVGQLRFTLGMSPDFYHAHWSLGRAYAQMGDFEEALFHLRRASEISLENPSILADLGHCSALMGRRAEALEYLRQIEVMARTRYVSPIENALIHAGLGQRSEAFAALERACEQRSRPLVWLNVDPRFDSLRGEPAFAALLARIGLGAENGDELQSRDC